MARSARAQVAEEASIEELTITRKRINKDLEVINVDLLEEQAKDVLSEGVYVFIAHACLPGRCLSWPSMHRRSPTSRSR